MKKRGMLIWGVSIGMVLGGFSVSRAAFVPQGGSLVERFDGTVKDTVTWKEIDLNGNNEGFTQNNELDTSPTGEVSKAFEYWTNTVQVGVGDTVSVRARNDAVGNSSRLNGLWLMDNNTFETRAGTISPANGKNITLGIQWNAGGDLIRGALATPTYGDDGDALRAGLQSDLRGAPLGEFITLQIRRVSATEIEFGATDPDNTSQLRLTTYIVPEAVKPGGITEDLYIALSVQRGDFIWDDVTITAVPEPAAGLLGLAGTLTLLRRQRRR